MQGFPGILRLIGWLLVVVAGLAGLRGGVAEAFEFFPHPEGKFGNRCQTSCHQPENILQAKTDKMKAPLCKECHSGRAAPFSPFQRSSHTVRLAAGPKTLGRLPSLEKKPAPRRRQNRSPAPHPKPPPDMAFVPGGEFVMGSNERWDDEAPEYIASTGPFFIDLYEATNAKYKKFVDAARYDPPFHWRDGKIPEGKENHPVVYVSWLDAANYCKWAGKRLPTEKEWEKAARGADGNIYPWGNFWDAKKSNNPYAYSTGTQPAGSYPEGRSPYGLYDMSGNVWEWVDSFYLPHPGNTAFRPEYGKRNRVLKGGSWFDCLSYGCGLSSPTFNRSFFTPEVRNNSFGFRCAKTFKQKVAQTFPLK